MNPIISDGSSVQVSVALREERELTRFEQLPAGETLFGRVPVDVTSLAPGQLNLEGRQRTNPFPWRGQFSPELVELLLSTYAPRAGRIWDAFAGVGTTLWEAARKGLEAVGTEINPAAFTMAQSVRFIPLTKEARQNAIASAQRRLDELLGRPDFGPLFNAGPEGAETTFVQAPRIAQAVTECGEGLDRIILSNVLLRAMEGGLRISRDVLARELKNYSLAILDLPRAPHEPTILNADARRTSLADGTIDLILTSPPYINVFNYHQNGRKAMEALGCDLLRVARSEFGANRKHRANRFLTVIQYALDMGEWLSEAHRVLTPEGTAIVVVGRASKVRGVVFRNGELLAALAEACGFRLARRQERRFVTRFGEPIFEDILHLVPIASTASSGSEGAREIALASLRSAMGPRLAPNVAKDLRDAIHAAGRVRSSPLFRGSH